ncbi:MAG TPA: hypothetical protein VIG40_00550, partial [Tissierellaceae bacterium]
MSKTLDIFKSENPLEDAIINWNLKPHTIIPREDKNHIVTRDIGVIAFNEAKLSKFYMKAAKILIEESLENHYSQNSHIKDDLILPIWYNYNHSLELWLKSMIRTLY